MKKLLSMVLALVMVAAMIPAVGVSAETEGNFTYTVSDGGAIITGFGSSYEGDVVIPDTLGGYAVTEIGDNAFYEHTGITSITIPEGVTSIGDYAFSWCTGLTSITIPDSVTSIGELAFNGCTGLTSITIPEGVTSIGDYAFAYCRGLTSIVVAEGNTSYKS